MGPNNEQNPEVCDAIGMLPQISGTSYEKPKLAKKIIYGKRNS